jgi:hypothetical protein
MKWLFAAAFAAPFVGLVLFVPLPGLGLPSLYSRRHINPVQFYAVIFLVVCASVAGALYCR